MRSKKKLRVKGKDGFWFTPGSSAGYREEAVVATPGVGDRALNGSTPHAPITQLPAARI